MMHPSLRRVLKMYDSLDIHAPKGTRVVPVYLDGEPYNGYASDKEKVKRLLKEGQVYTIERIEVGDSHSYVYLMEFPNEPFNSVCLAPVRDDGELSDHRIQQLAEQHVPMLYNEESGQLITAACRGFYAEALKMGRDAMMFPTGAAIDAGWKCANAAMVLHDHYRASGDQENAELCKRIAQEWRAAMVLGRVWSEQEVLGILQAAERQVESMSDGKLKPRFSELLKKNDLPVQESLRTYIVGSNGVLGARTPSCVILAHDLAEAEEIAARTITHTKEYEVHEHLQEAGVVVYLNEDR